VMSRPNCCLCHDTTDGCSSCGGHSSRRPTSPVTLANRLLEEWFPGKRITISGKPTSDGYEVWVRRRGECKLTHNGSTKELAVREALLLVRRYAEDEGLALPAWEMAA